MPTSDDYARATIRAGQDLGISPRGIKIGLATNLVEAGPTAGTGPGPILMYANAKVPESLRLPHDAVGSDGYSVGTFQQQIRRGNGGAWWWADAATCMDPYKSAVLFFTRLKALNYNDTARSPGSFAQAVQGSAYPGRYDQRFSEASALYDRLVGGSAPVADYGITKTMHGYNANSVGIGNSNGPRRSTPYFVLHTQQGKSTAENLARFCNNSAGGSNPVAYNLVVDGRETIVVVPLNEGPWAAADANNIGIHLCFAGSFAEWTRGQWLGQTDYSGDGIGEDASITRAAKALAAAHLEYKIPLVYAGDGGRSGWPVKASGVVGHMDFGARGGGHTDPGREFIDGVMTTLLKRAQTFITPEPVLNLINVAADVAKAWIGKRLAEAGDKGETILRAKNGAEIGRFVPYENAHVYWRKGERAAFVVPHGGLFEAWAEYGWESGPLGFPVRDFTKLEDGAVQAFQGGVLYRKDGADGFYVTGVIGARYLKEGAELGDLGYPVSNEYDNGTGGRRQDFERGVLDWDPSGAVKTIYTKEA
ncbi:endolysin [Gordonia phage Mahdia]|uniref:Endolysin n=1 Tax=Gordonia phage Mahdia TaxID=2047873 RepID=A0A2H4PA14_9CAUD|nr:endolysin [Gordonia phage Mahdia]ATW59020.1 endolysin [Gordonia phage Mahdia]